MPHLLSSHVRPYAQRSEAIHSAIKRVIGNNMKLLEVLEELVHYVDMKEIKAERVAEQRAHLLAAKCSTMLPAVGELLQQHSITSYAGQILSAQAALSGKYSVAQVAGAADSTTVMYIVAPMGPLANKIAATYAAAHAAAVADGSDAAAAAAITAVSVQLAAGGQADAAASPALEQQVGGLEWQVAADYCIHTENQLAWRLTSLKSCSCQFHKHKG